MGIKEEDHRKGRKKTKRKPRHLDPNLNRESGNICESGVK